MAVSLSRINTRFRNTLRTPSIYPDAGLTIQVFESGTAEEDRLRYFLLGPTPDSGHPYRRRSDRGRLAIDIPEDTGQSGCFANRPTYFLPNLIEQDQAEFVSDFGNASSLGWSRRIEPTPPCSTDDQWRAMY
jgi:hypothetical protein